MKIIKIKKNKKSAAFFLGSIALFSTISALAAHPIINDANQLTSYVNQNKTLSINNQSVTQVNSTTSLPTINDKNGKTILFGNNVIRLNNKVVFKNNQLVSKSVLGVYDKWNTALQTIDLDPSYNNLSEVNIKNISEGIVVSNEKGSALWFGIDLANKKIIDHPEAVNVIDNTYTVGASFNKLQDKKEVKKPVVVSVQALANSSGSYYVNISVTTIESRDSYVKKLDLPSLDFNNIKLVNSFAIDNNLYLGINLYQNTKIAGSELILLTDGNLISGGPSFVLPFQLNSLVYDQEHNSIYAQYLDVADKSLRMWGFDVNSPDSFAQLGTIPSGSIFSQMVYVNGYGVAALNQSKTSISLFKFRTNSFISAPDFSDPKIIYISDFVNNNSDLVSDFIFNPNTNQFSIFYSADYYVDGIITWNFDQDKNVKPNYENIIPVHINYQKLIDLMQEPVWKNSFASVYAKDNLNNSFQDFLIIPSYYKTIQNNALLNNNKSFLISYQSSENLGSFIINVAASHNGSDNTGVLLTQTISGFTKVLPSDIVVNYNNSSPLLEKTPSEVQSLLNNPQTSEQIKNEVFDLFGINSKYQVLPFNVKIIDSDVLGKIKFQIEFPTIQNAPLIQQAKIISKANNQSMNSGPVVFDNTFKISIEHWFIPVVTVASLIMLILILIGLWFLFGKNLYWKIATKSRERMELQYAHINANLDQDKDLDFKGQQDVIKSLNVSREEVNSLKERFKEEKPFAVKAIQNKDLWKIHKKDPGIKNFHEFLKQKNLNWTKQLNC